MNKDKVDETMKSMDDMSQIEPYPRPEKMEFSKKIVIGVFAVAMIVIVYSMYIMWETKDLSPMGYFLSGIFAAVTASLSFYFYKSKVENQLKLRALYGERIVQMAEQDVENDKWSNESNNDYNNFI